MSHYYKLPDETEEVIGLALALRNDQIFMGEINPVSLCRRLVVEIRILQRELKAAKTGKPVEWPDDLNDLTSAP